MASGYDAVMGIPAEDGLSLTLSRACHELVISWAAVKPWEFIGGGTSWPRWTPRRQPHQRLTQLWQPQARPWSSLALGNTT